jgi:hypothetical protein
VLNEVESKRCTMQMIRESEWNKKCTVGEEEGSDG